MTSQERELKRWEANNKKFAARQARAEAWKRAQAVTAKPATCVGCDHPMSSHFRFAGDPGCYHTMGCTCLAYTAKEVN